MNNKRIIFWAILFITLIAFFLRVLPFGYGMSAIDFSDTELFTHALNLGKAFVDKDLSQFKTPAGYPYFFSYIYLFFFGIFYLIGTMINLFSSSAEFIKSLIVQMESFFETSRIIVSISGALLIPLVYLVTKKLVKPKYKENKWLLFGSFLATILMTFSLIHIHFAKVIRPHVLVSLFLFLAFYFYLILLEKKNFSSYAGLAIFSGAAAGTLQTGLISILFLILPLFFFKKIPFWKFSISLLLFLLIIVISYPYAFLSPKESLNLETGKIDITLSGGKYQNFVDSKSDFSGKGFSQQLKGLFFYESGLIIILIFLLMFLKRKEIKKYITPGITGLILFIVIYFLVFGFYSQTGTRMLAPLIPFLCAITGILAFTVLNKKYRYWIIIFIALILIFPIIQSVRLTSLATKQSTQDLAAKWIKKNINPDKIVAIEGHAGIKIIPNQESIKKQIDLVGIESIGQRSEFLFSLNKENYPKNTGPVFPLSVFKEDYNKIEEFLKTKADYLTVGYLNSNSSQQPIYQIVSSLNKQTIKRFSPFKKESSITSNFPQFMNNPIIDLWTFKRMGPIIEIYKINH